ncbi:ATP-binding cassette domain-containing protein [Spirochaeta dissipatitropha]
MSVPLLSVEGLSISFPGKRGSKSDFIAVDNISFHVNRSEQIAIVGESGSGKTVSCLALTRLIEHYGGRISRGSVSYEGNAILDMSPEALLGLRRKNISYIFQDPVKALTEHQSIEQHFISRLRSAGITNRTISRKRIETALTAAQLKPESRILSAFPRALSGGMAQRIMIALALLFEPDLLIADEPSTALDLSTQTEIVSMLSELCHERHMSMILVTHDIGLAAHISQRIMVMKDGQIIEQGTTANILSNPGQPYTRTLLKSVPLLKKHHENSTEVQREAVLEIQNLNVNYNGAFHAVKDTSLCIYANQITGIIGESGSGKSSLLKAVTGIIDSSGDIRYRGAEVHEMTARERQGMRSNLQMIFQNPFRSFQPSSKILFSIQEPLFRLGTCSASERSGLIQDICRKVGLEIANLDRLPSQYSGGQLQRASIARSLSTEPEILFADEASSSLDVSIQSQVLLLLKRIQETTGLSIVFVTHDLAAAVQICDRIVVMEQGRIIEEGSVTEILETPKHPYTRKLVEAARYFDPGKFIGESVHVEE